MQNEHGPGSDLVIASCAGFACVLVQFICLTRRRAPVRAVVQGLDGAACPTSKSRPGKLAAVGRRSRVCNGEARVSDASPEASRSLALCSIRGIGVRGVGEKKYSPQEESGA